MTDFNILKITDNTLELAQSETPSFVFGLEAGINGASRLINQGLGLNPESMRSHAIDSSFGSQIVQAAYRHGTFQSGPAIIAGIEEGVEVTIDRHIQGGRK